MASRIIRKLAQLLDGTGTPSAGTGPMYTSGTQFTFVPLARTDQNVEFQQSVVVDGALTTSHSSFDDGSGNTNINGSLAVSSSISTDNGAITSDGSGGFAVVGLTVTGSFSIGSGRFSVDGSGNVAVGGSFNCVYGAFVIDGVGNITVADAKNISTGTTTGTKIGTATTQKLAFHNSSPVVQRSGAAQVAVATTSATNTSPYGFTTSAQANAIVTLLNELRAALVEKGIIKGSA